MNQWILKRGGTAKKILMWGKCVCVYKQFLMYDGLGLPTCERTEGVLDRTQGLFWTRISRVRKRPLVFENPCQKKAQKRFGRLGRPLGALRGTPLR